MSVNRNVTVPVGKAADASRATKTLSVGPLPRTPGKPIVEPRLRNLGARFRGAPNAKARRARTIGGTHQPPGANPCPQQPSPPKPASPNIPPRLRPPPSPQPTSRVATARATP